MMLSSSPQFYVTYVGLNREVMVTRAVNGTVRYLGHVLAKSKPLLYPADTGQAVVAALESAHFLFEEARWIEREQDKLPTGRPASVFAPPKKHDASYSPASTFSNPTAKSTAIIGAKRPILGLVRGAGLYPVPILRRES